MSLINIKSIKYQIFRSWAFILLIGLFIIVAALEIYLIGVKNLQLSLILRVSMYTALFFFFWTYGKWIPYAYWKILESDQLKYLFNKSTQQNKSEKIYSKYIDLIKKYFDKKYIIIVALIIAIIVFVLEFYHFGISTNFKYRMINNKKIFIESNKKPLFIFQVLLLCLLLSILSYVVVIICFFILAIFQSIMKTNKAEFQFNLSYSVLRGNSFDLIGEFLISLMIPIISITAAFGVMGLVQVFIFNEMLIGILLVVLGFLIAVVISLLLYFSTRHIHLVIKHQKYLMKTNLLQKIEILYNKNELEKIKAMHECFDEINSIKEWPINPSTFKAILTYLSSSLIPLILALFGI